MSLPSPDVLISEVGPRDGLQSVAATMPAEHKKRWLTALHAAGLREIEVASFVPAKLLPQMADAAQAPQVRIEASISTAFACTLQGDYGMTPEAGLPKGFVQEAAHA